MANSGPVSGARKVVMAAAAANLAIALSKFAAFGLTGSSAMLTEGIHSLVDTGNQGLLLMGQRRSARPPNPRHPFGYGMEAYFWSFIVALMIFALGGAVSIWEGVHKLRDPEPIRMAWVNFLVLGLAIVFEGLSFRVAWREFNAVRQGRPVLATIRGSKDPNLFAVLLEDAAALAGLVIALLGVTATAVAGWPYGDGLASVGVGLLLVLVAVFLANETRSLLTGESAAPDLVARVRRLVEDDPLVVEATEVLSLHLGPNEILFAITLDFRDDLAGGAVERAADALSRRVEAADPRITRVFLRPGRRAA